MMQVYRQKVVFCFCILTHHGLDQTPIWGQNTWKIKKIGVIWVWGHWEAIPSGKPREQPARSPLWQLPQTKRIYPHSSGPSGAAGRVTHITTWHLSLLHTRGVQHKVIMLICICLVLKTFVSASYSDLKKGKVLRNILESFLSSI